MSDKGGELSEICSHCEATPFKIIWSYHSVTLSIVTKPLMGAFTFFWQLPRVTKISIQARDSQELDFITSRLLEVLAKISRGTRTKLVI